MARIVVAGAGVAGMCGAMMLARDGHQVVVLERDAAPPVEPGLAWDRWARPGVAQFRLPHALLPRFRQVMDEELPDVAAALEAAGALRSNRVAVLPPSMTGGVRPGDQRFDTITGRRPLVEAALARMLDDHPGITVRRGVTVRQLAIADPKAGDDVPRVDGVVTDARERIDADLVVDAGGRRSTLPQLLTMAGARSPVEDIADSGYVYYARHFRRTDGAMPTMVGPPLHTYTSLQTATLPADHGWWSVVIVASARDRALHRLTDPDVWQRLVASYPLIAPWVEAEPMTKVDVMAGVTDRVRHFLIAGRPVATGIVAVGDAAACTNPSLGRGISIAALQLASLRRVVQDVGTDDAEGLTMAFEARRAAEADPYLGDTLRTSAHRLAQLEAHAAGVAYEPDDPGWRIAAKLQAAAPTDPELLRAALDVGGLLARGEDVLKRPGLAARLAATPDTPPFPGPDRDEVLAIVGAGGASRHERTRRAIA